MDGMSLPEDHQPGRPNCGLVALSVAARVTLAEATAAYLKVAGPKRGTWKGTTEQRHYVKVLWSLGVVAFAVHPHRRMTLKTWARDYARPGTRYFVRTTGHAQVVMDGAMTDQRGTAPIAERKRSGGKIVTHAWKLED